MDTIHTFKFKVPALRRELAAAGVAFKVLKDNVDSRAVFISTAPENVKLVRSLVGPFV